MDLLVYLRDLAKVHMTLAHKLGSDKTDGCYSDERLKTAWADSSEMSRTWADKFVQSLDGDARKSLISRKMEYLEATGSWRGERKLAPRQSGIPIVSEKQMESILSRGGSKNPVIDKSLSKVVDQSFDMDMIFWRAVSRNNLVFFYGIRVSNFACFFVHSAGEGGLWATDAVRNAVDARGQSLLDVPLRGSSGGRGYLRWDTKGRQRLKLVSPPNSVAKAPTLLFLTDRVPRYMERKVKVGVENNFSGHELLEASLRALRTWNAIWDKAVVNEIQLPKLGLVNNLLLKNRLGRKSLAIASYIISEIGTLHFLGGFGAYLDTALDYLREKNGADAMAFPDTVLQIAQEVFFVYSL